MWITLVMKNHKLSAVQNPKTQRQRGPDMKKYNIDDFKRKTQSKQKKIMKTIIKY